MVAIAQRISQDKAHKARRFRFATKCLTEETTMRKSILAVLGAVLVSASSFQFAGAAEHHQVRHIHKGDRAAITQQFRRANDSVISPSAAPEYYEGHGLSAPAGRS
jgi:hypothetical protein